MALIVTELELTAVPLTADATLKEKFDVGSVTVRSILIVSPAAILQMLSRMMTRPLLVSRPPLVPAWRQFAAFSSTSETLVAPDTGTLPALSVTVMLSPAGMALGATAVIT